MTIKIVLKEGELWTEPSQMSIPRQRLDNREKEGILEKEASTTSSMGIKDS